MHANAFTRSPFLAKSRASSKYALAIPRESSAIRLLNEPSGADTRTFESASDVIRMYFSTRSPLRTASAHISHPSRRDDLDALAAVLRLPRPDLDEQRSEEHTSELQSRL